MKLYVCKHCGNIIEKVIDKGVPVICCGEKMAELEPNTSDGAFEKHVPAVTEEGSAIRVVIGSVEHPMLEEHHIEWIILETDKGIYRKNLQPGEVPKAEFILADGEKPLAAYEYCNLHGFWKKEI